MRSPSPTLPSPADEKSPVVLGREAMHHRRVAAEPAAGEDDGAGCGDRARLAAAPDLHRLDAAVADQAFGGDAVSSSTRPVARARAASTRTISAGSTVWTRGTD
ncbi:MAG: hypothetical protein WDN49_24015 [Acetobacteraceae bacterium]